MSIVNRVKAGLSAASNMLSGKKTAVKEKLAADAQPAEVSKEEPSIQPVRKSRKKILSEVLQGIVAEVTPARRIGSNSKLSLPEQEKIQQAAAAKRERRMKRSNGWSAN